MAGGYFNRTIGRKMKCLRPRSLFLLGPLASDRNNVFDQPEFPGRGRSRTGKRGFTHLEGWTVRNCEKLIPFYRGISLSFSGSSKPITLEAATTAPPRRPPWLTPIPPDSWIPSMPPPLKSR